MDAGGVCSLTLALPCTNLENHCFHRSTFVCCSILNGRKHFLICLELGVKFWRSDSLRLAQSKNSDTVALMIYILQGIPSKVAIPEDFYHKKWYNANDVYKQLDAARVEVSSLLPARNSTRVLSCRFCLSPNRVPRVVLESCESSVGSRRLLTANSKAIK